LWALAVRGATCARPTAQSPRSIRRSVYTSPFAINPAGAVKGYFRDGSGCHGFLRDPQGAITAFDPLGSFFTFATDINSAGAIIGSYYDANGAHGFLRLP
jgi:hypothetical protein